VQRVISGFARWDFGDNVAWMIFATEQQIMFRTSCDLVSWREQWIDAHF
jgi:hypothetical protein